MKVEEKKREGIFEKMAMFFYRKCASGGFMGFSGKGIEADLRQLYPGESPEWVKTKYYVKKLALSLKVLAAGSLLAVGTACLAEQPVLQQETNSLQRGSPGEGEKQIELEAEYKDRKYSFSLPFSARVWTGEEAQEKLDCLEEKLPELILGKNESIDGIRENLNLFSLYKGYAPKVEWESSNPEVVTKEGEVCPGKQPEEVVLTATLTCGEYSREVVLNTVVVPEELSETEKWQRQMENYLLAKEEADRELEELELPAEWGGEVILWSQKRENRVGIVLVLTMLSAGMAYYLADRDLHGQVKNRKKKLQGEYAAFVYELVLLIQAGMTVKAAFRKLGEDYEKNRAEGGKECLALEEVLRTNREMQSGVAEGAAYERFGRRTGVRQYIRLSSFLVQNLKRGNRNLPEKLREEAFQAGEEKLQQGKRLGEEAGTKLLIPMVMLLAVVMLLIMIPVFSGIG